MCPGYRTTLAVIAAAPERRVCLIGALPAAAPPVAEVIVDGTIWYIGRWSPSLAGIEHSRDRNRRRLLSVSKVRNVGRSSREVPASGRWMEASSGLAC